MASAPTLSSGTSVAKYPLVRSVKSRTSVLTFADFTEQRFAKGVPLTSFTLTFNNVSTVDKDKWKDFFNGRKGSFDTTWDMTLNDDPEIFMDNLQFMPGQQFEATNIKPDRWRFTLSVRQTRPA